MLTGGLTVKLGLVIVAGFGVVSARGLAQKPVTVPALTVLEGGKKNEPSRSVGRWAHVPPQEMLKESLERMLIMTEELGMGYGNPQREPETGLWDHWLALPMQETGGAPSAALQREWLLDVARTLRGKIMRGGLFAQGDRRYASLPMDFPSGRFGEFVMDLSEPMACL